MNHRWSELRVLHWLESISVGTVKAVNDTVLILVVVVIILVMKRVHLLAHLIVGLTSFGFLTLLLELSGLDLSLLRRALPLSFLLIPFKLLGFVGAL